MISQHIQGPVPTPDLLSGYSADHQERIFRIAESFSSDESSRRDQIVKSSVAVTQRDQWIKPVTLFGAFAFALGSYAMFRDVLLSGLFLSVPVLRVIGSSVATAIRNRNRQDDQTSE